MSKKLDFDFLAVNKDFFKLGLNPTEILILSQIAEFIRNTGDCFMSDKAFAEAFGVSESTISREMKKLENEFGYIKRETTNKKSGKERHIKINTNKINEKLASVNLPVAESNEVLPNVILPVAQEANCLLENKQNEFIKEKNEKKNEKDNLCEVNQPSVDITSLLNPVGEEVEEAPRVEEIKVDGRIARKDLLNGYYEYINAEQTLIKTPIGKIFEVYDNNINVVAIAASTPVKPKAQFMM